MKMLDEYLGSQIFPLCGCLDWGIVLQDACMNRFQRGLLLMALALAASLAVSGCGGINASGGVSPSTFLIPGIL